MSAARQFLEDLLAENIADWSRSGNGPCAVHNKPDRDAVVIDGQPVVDLLAKHGVGYGPNMIKLGMPGSLSPFHKSFVAFRGHRPAEADRDPGLIYGNMRGVYVQVFDRHADDEPVSSNAPEGTRFEVRYTTYIALDSWYVRPGVPKNKATKKDLFRYGKTSIRWDAFGENGDLLVSTSKQDEESDHSAEARLVFSFMSCKNVRLIDHILPEKRIRKMEARGLVAIPQWKTLEVGPMIERLRSDGGMDQVGFVRAMHICAGSFADYAEDRPMFGKYPGRFWRPQHVRGNAERGIVGKEYRVRISDERP